MKILLRNWGGSHYVWKDASWNRGRFFIEPEKVEVSQISILAIKDDKRADEYVMCVHCGAMIKNDLASIEAHYAEMEAKRDCTKCKNMRENAIDTFDVNYTKNADGTYTVKKTILSSLRCKMDWYSPPDINSDRAKQICIYHQCRRQGTQKISDIFTKYPGIFDKNATVDALVAKKYAHDTYRDGFFEYDLKCRNTVKACVNKAGIVDHFIIKSRGYSYIAFYSAKYNKIFWTENGRDYTEAMPYYMTDNKLEMAMKKIADLYKGD